MSERMPDYNLHNLEVALHAILTSNTDGLSPAQIAEKEDNVLSHIMLELVSLQDHVKQSMALRLLRNLCQRGLRSGRSFTVLIMEGFQKLQQIGFPKTAILEVLEKLQKHATVSSGVAPVEALVCHGPNQGSFRALHQHNPNVIMNPQALQLPIHNAIRYESSRSQVAISPSPIRVSNVANLSVDQTRLPHIPRAVTNARFTVLVGKAIFAPGKKPNQKNLHEILKKSFPSLLCPAGCKFATVYMNYSQTDRPVPKKNIVFKCGCAKGEKSEKCIQLKLSFSVKRGQNKLLPISNECEIWSNTYGSPPSPCTHYNRNEDEWTGQDGIIRKEDEGTGENDIVTEAKASIKNKVTQDTTQAEIGAKCDTNSPPISFSRQICSSSSSTSSNLEGVQDQTQVHVPSKTKRQICSSSSSSSSSSLEGVQDQIQVPVPPKSTRRMGASSSSSSTSSNLEGVQHQTQVPVSPKSTSGMGASSSSSTPSSNLDDADIDRTQDPVTPKAAHNARFTVFEGDASFPMGQKINQKNLHEILKSRFPALICPAGHKFASSYVYFSNTNSTSSMKNMVFRCGCGSSTDTIQLKLCFPAERENDGIIHCNIWRNTYGSPPRPCTHAPPLRKAWNDEGGLSMEAKAFIDSRITRIHRWPDMKMELDEHFGHIVSTGPRGYTLAAQNYFRAARRKLKTRYPESLLREGNFNKCLQFLFEKDFFFTTNIPRVEFAGPNKAAGSPLQMDEHATIQDLMRALLVDESDLKHYYTVAVRKDDIPVGTSDKDRRDALATFFIITPALLFNLWQFLTMDEDMQVLHSDETYNVLSTDHLFYTWGGTASDIHHGIYNGLITRQYRPFLYQLTLLKNKLAGILAIRCLKRLAASVFGMKFAPSCVVIDYSMMLWSAAKAELPGVKLVRCFIHILHPFSKPHWVATHFSDVRNMREVRKAIMSLHLCTTSQQFEKLSELFCQDWRNRLQEVKFADYFDRYLGPSSRCKGMWWIGCIGHVGATPDNNSTENYWRSLKGVAVTGGKRMHRENKVMSLGVGLAEFFEEQVTKLVKYDATYRTGFNNYRNAKEAPYQFMPTEWLAAATMICREDVYEIPGSTSYLVPSLHRLIHGQPATEDDYANYCLAKQGKVKDSTERVDGHVLASYTEDFHLVTLFSDDNVEVQNYDNHPSHVKTGHFHFGSVCECKDGMHHYNCYAQMAIKNLHRSEMLEYSLEDRCENELVTRTKNTKVCRKRRMSDCYPKKRKLNDGSCLPIWGMWGDDPLIRLLYKSCSLNQLHNIRKKRKIEIPPETYSKPVRKVELVELCIAGTTYLEKLLERRNEEINEAEVGLRLSTTHQNILKGYHAADDDTSHSTDSFYQLLSKDLTEGLSPSTRNRNVPYYDLPEDDDETVEKTTTVNEVYTNKSHSCQSSHFSQSGNDENENALPKIILVPTDLDNENIWEQDSCGSGLHEQGLSTQSLATLKSGQWLNDEIINCYLTMVLFQDTTPEKRQFHFFKSFFYTKLCNVYDENNRGVYCYENVRRWTKRIPGGDIFKLKMMFFICNVDNTHWFCVVCNIQKRRIQVMDSMGQPRQQYLDNIFRYIQDEHLDKRKYPLPHPEKWNLITCTADTPKQTNSFDCGVFTCMFCDYLANGFPLNFGQPQVTEYRRKMELLICRQGRERQATEIRNVKETQTNVSNNDECGEFIGDTESSDDGSIWNAGFTTLKNNDKVKDTRVRQNSRKLPPRGLKNLGNTCFLNCILQCLAYSPDFGQYLMHMQQNASLHCNGDNTSKNITAKLSELFCLLHNRDNISKTQFFRNEDPISPVALHDLLPRLGGVGNFINGRQEDAHEFLVHLLADVAAECPKVDKMTLVQRLFGGFYQSQVQCQECGKSSNTMDSFLDLALEIHPDICNSLETALDYYTRKEMIEYKCSECKRTVRATKHFTVSTPPLTLCIQLKRFSFDYQGGEKITKAIEFPVDLKLQLSDNGTCDYSLSGFVIHKGDTNSGHYISYVRQQENGLADLWFCLDDDRVKPVCKIEETLQSEALRSEAYILFYFQTSGQRWNLI